MKKYNKIIKTLLVTLWGVSLLLTGFDVRANETVDESILTVESEETEELNDSSADGLDSSVGITPFAAAQPVTKYNITGVYGSTAEEDPIDETFPESVQNNSDYYTARAQHTYNASKALKFTVSQRGTQATYKIISPECTVTKGDPYGLIFGGDGGVLEFTQDYIITDINPETKELRIQCILMTTYSSGGNIREIDREIIIPISSQRSAEPVTPEIIFDEQYPDSYLLTGTDSTMEYTSFQNPYRAATVNTYEWKDCTEEAMPLSPGTTEMYYLIRYKATEGNEASNYKQLKLPKQAAAPNLTLDKQKELITGLTEEMEYCLGEDDYIPVTEAFVQGDISGILDKITEDSVNMKIRFRANGKPASLEKDFTLYKRLETPQTITLNQTTFDVGGVKSGMEYQADTMDTWTSISKTVVNVGSYGLSDREVSVKIRNKATATASNSKPVVVILPKLENAPTGLTIDYTEETIKGFDPSHYYQVSTTATGTYGNISLSNGVWNIKNYILTTGDKELYIRKAATAEKPFSAPTKIVIPKRRSNPDNNIKFVYNDPSTDDSQALLINVNEQIEYRPSNSSTWTTCPGETAVVNLPAAKTTYYLRSKPTDSAFVSSQGQVQLLAPAVPNNYISISSEVLCFKYATLEYKINNGEFKPAGDANTTIDLAPIADSLSPGQTYTITIRWMRSETRPASQNSVVQVYPRPEPPKGLKYDSSTYILSGVSNKMEWREVGTDKWSSISGTTTQINYKTFLSIRPYNVQIEYRYRVSGSTFASYSTIVNLYD